MTLVAFAKNEEQKANGAAHHNGHPAITAPISKSSGESAFVIKEANEWLNDAKSRPVSKKLFGDLWFEDEICIFFSDTNLGKTILGVQIAEAIARGESQGYFTVETGAQSVLYIDFELSDKQFEHRYAVRDGDYFGNHYVFSPNFHRAEINPDLDDIPAQFEDFEEHVIHSLGLAIAKYAFKVVIVDNITYLQNETERSRYALTLMKELKKLKRRFGFSLLVLAHTPKRDATRPITPNDLAGSKMLMNFADSSFAIGQSQKDGGLRYIKQVKSRNGEFIYDGEHVQLCQITKPENFLRFEFLECGNEFDHLKTMNQETRENLINEVKQMYQSGKRQRDIAFELKISLGSVNKYLKKG